MLAAPNQGSIKSVSDAQLAERDEAIHGGGADHIQDQKARGDTVITEQQISHEKVKHTPSLPNLP